VSYYMEMEDGSIDLAWIFNVNRNVGLNLMSRKPDVMLVQHALNTVMAKLDLKEKSGKTIHYLTRNGICDQAAADAIAAYQRNLVERGRFVKTDGFVSPSSRSGWTKNGDAQFTIVYLNRDHLQIQGKMMEEKDFPLELQADIKANAHLGKTPRR
jgi:hypothetical protein